MWLNIKGKNYFNRLFWRKWDISRIIYGIQKVDILLLTFYVTRKYSCIYTIAFNSYLSIIRHDLSDIVFHLLLVCIVFIFIL